MYLTCMTISLKQVDTIMGQHTWNPEQSLSKTLQQSHKNQKKVTHEYYKPQKEKQKEEMNKEKLQKQLENKE